MSRASAARKQRRALKSAGVSLMDRVVIDDLALDLAIERGANVVELVAYHVGESLERIDAQGGDVLGQCAVTIGRHPDFPGGVTVETKVASRKPAASSLERGSDDEA
jgi:hypothetical protein